MPNTFIQSLSLELEFTSQGALYTYADELAGFLLKSSAELRINYLASSPVKLSSSRRSFDLVRSHNWAGMSFILKNSIFSPQEVGLSVAGRKLQLNFPSGSVLQSFGDIAETSSFEIEHFQHLDVTGNPSVGVWSLVFHNKLLHPASFNHFIALAKLKGGFVTGHLWLVSGTRQKLSSWIFDDVNLTDGCRYYFCKETSVVVPAEGRSHSETFRLVNEVAEPIPDTEERDAESLDLPEESLGDELEIVEEEILGGTSPINRHPLENFKDVESLSDLNFCAFVATILEEAGWHNVFKYNSAKSSSKDYFLTAKRTGRNFLAMTVKADFHYKFKASQLTTFARLGKELGISNLLFVTNGYLQSELKLTALRCGIEVIDHDRLQNLWVEKRSEVGRRIQPRKYQQTVIDDSLQLFDSGQDKVLIEMATGLGKTYTVACLLREVLNKKGKQQKVLFLIHQIEILLQSLTAFRNVFGTGHYSFSACFDGSQVEDTDFVFATFDTMALNMSKLNSHHFDIVIVDEAHHAAANTYRDVVEHFHPSYLIGLTATPHRQDRKDVFEIFGGHECHVGKYDLAWALKHKKLAFPKYTVLLDDLDQSKLDHLQMGMRISDLDKQLFLHKKYEEVIRIVEKTIAEKNISNPKAIVFCESIKHMHHLLPFFDDGTATLVHSNMKDNERRLNIRKFREGTYHYILVCDLFNEGVDIPETNILVFLRFTKSRTIWLQQLGRGLRKTQNKDTVEVLDFVGSLDRLSDIEYLNRKVRNTELEIENIEEEPRTKEKPEREKKETVHDSSIEVTYNKETAKILELIESLNSRLTSRPQALETLREYYRINDRIPEIEEIEDCLEDITYDSVASNFRSYYGYIQQALGPGADIHFLTERVLENLNEFYHKHGSIPSIRALSVNTQYKRLLLFTEIEIQELIGSQDELKSYLDHDEELPSTDNSAQEPEGQEVLLEDLEMQSRLLSKYRGEINSFDEYLNLSFSEKKEIQKCFFSEFRFLQRLEVTK